MPAIIRKHSRIFLVGSELFQLNVLQLLIHKPRCVVWPGVSLTHSTPGVLMQPLVQLS